MHVRNWIQQQSRFSPCSPSLSEQRPHPVADLNEQDSLPDKKSWNLTCSEEHKVLTITSSNRKVSQSCPHFLQVEATLCWPICLGEQMFYLRDDFSWRHVGDQLRRSANAGDWHGLCNMVRLKRKQIEYSYSCPQTHIILLRYRSAQTFLHEPNTLFPVVEGIEAALWAIHTNGSCSFCLQNDSICTGSANYPIATSPACGYLRLLLVLYPLKSEHLSKDILD